jgi:AcrR family transcriptional regulator
MARKPQTRPRKIASQDRSRLTVESLLDATARVLVKEGYGKASTNRIAEVAGVSIGSLYQYFPGKEALVAAVIERHTRELSQVVREALVPVAARPVEVVARALVSAAIDAHLVDPELHRVLDEQVPRRGRSENVEAIDRDLYTMVRAYMETRRDDIGVADLDVAAFVCVTTVEALTHSAVLRRPEILAGSKARRFVDEVAGMVVRFLQGPRDAGV